MLPLSNLGRYLRKLARTQRLKNAPSVLINAKLYPDMLPLSRQIQIASLSQILSISVRLN
ncbi:DUF1993 family protein [Candidatus Nitrotoga arctica]|uniref:DUF1993 family protein n=1 Tax=Candidatus Nitrotoga arctica TaxID=453162 RepID=UPI003B969ECC